MIVEEFDGEVPQTMDELVRLPGVARKTANIVQGNSYPERHRRDRAAGIRPRRPSQPARSRARRPGATRRGAARWNAGS
jgi:hypothetical protein